jgi:hypothetical protein
VAVTQDPPKLGLIEYDGRGTPRCSSGADWPALAVRLLTQINFQSHTKECQFAQYLA